MNTKHTPGPWSVHCGEDYTVVVHDDETTDTASYRVFNPRGNTHAPMVASALNIYAETGLTPRQLADQRAELLEALKGMMERYGNGIENINRDTKAAQAAIAKAEGR